MLFASGEPYYIWHAALIYLLARFRWRSRVHIMMHLFYPCKRHTFTRKKRGDLYRITNGSRLISFDFLAHRSRDALPSGAH
ncbi:hypothetical protein Peur_060014 [Populus x canadensis]